MNWETFLFLMCLGLAGWVVRQPKVIAIVERAQNKPFRKHLPTKEVAYHTTFVCSKCENPDIDVCRMECPHYKDWTNHGS